MNERHDPEAWSDLDDTLADGPSPASVPEEAKAWLGDQRFMHGLLRALHTADAAARESRIAALLERIDRESVVEPRRRWLTVAAVALLLACLGVWFALPASLPTAEAAMGRAVAQLARDVDRRFRLEMIASDATGKEQTRNEFSLVTRPGMRFRSEGKLAFGPMQFGEIRVGCDGEELWAVSANGILRRAVPLAERERLMRVLGDTLDLGYLDVHDLVRKLPDDFDLRVIGREQDAAGCSQLRIEATRRQTAARGRFRSAWLVCDEVTGMVTTWKCRSDFWLGPRADCDSSTSAKNRPDSSTTGSPGRRRQPRPRSSVTTRTPFLQSRPARERAE